MYARFCAALLAAAVTASFVIPSAPAQSPASPPSQIPGTAAGAIKDSYKDRFLIGTAGDVPGGFTPAELDLIRSNFNIITPENYLKPAAVHPAENIWSFDRTDALVDWCRSNNIAVHGHTLLWHAQTNGWFFEGGDRDTVIQRMQSHIATLVGRYKGKIHSWDVVNEAINDGNNPTSENLRNSQWLQTVGPDFLTLAFKAAHAADPAAKLYYNDYNIEAGAKHQSSLLLLKRLLAEGAPVHGVGIQGHWSTRGLPLDQLDRALTNYAALGLKVSISELDITVAGSSGGQLNPTFGTPAAPPSTQPAAGRGAPGAAGGGMAGGPGRGGPGRGGPGGGGRGPAAAPQPSVAPVADSIRTLVPDLSEDQKAKLAAASQDLAAKLAQWQSASQNALLVVQPQYTPGQLAYQHEIALFNATQFKQNALRDKLLNEAELAMASLLTPAQADAWAKARLKDQLNARLGPVALTDTQQTAAGTLIASHAKNLLAAKSTETLAASKAAFWKDSISLLDDAQISLLLAPSQDGSPGRGRPAAVSSAEALAAQADAYARLFAVLDKHKDTIERVTFWGLNDRRSWRAGENPLLFDINNQPKPAFDAVVKASSRIP